MPKSYNQLTTKDYLTTIEIWPQKQINGTYAGFLFGQNRNTGEESCMALDGKSIVELLNTIQTFLSDNPNMVKFNHEIKAGVQRK